SMLGLLVIRDVHEDVHRPEELTRVIMEGVGVGQHGASDPIGSFDHDFFTVEFSVLLQASGRPAFAVTRQLAVGREKPKGASVAVHGIVQLRFPPPGFDRPLIEIGDEAICIAGICGGRQLIEETAKRYVSILMLTLPCRTAFPHECTPFWWL